MNYFLCIVLSAFVCGYIYFKNMYGMGNTKFIFLSSAYSPTNPALEYPHPTNFS